jgi:Tol biopolymer transport system component
MLTRFVFSLILFISTCCTAGIIGALLVGGTMRDAIVTYLALVNAVTSDYDVMVMDSRTRVAHNLTRHPASDFNYAWSPDGSRLAFLSNRAGDSDIYLMSAAGREVQPLKTGLNPQGLAWSPDGSRIGFLAARESGLYDVYTVLLSDGSIKNLSDTMVVNDSALVWSPDGSRMLFVQENHAVRVMNADGSEKVYVNETSPRSVPVWSPDGSHITHFHWDGVLHLTAADGAVSTVLAGDLGLPSPLAWSPDGASLARVVEIDEQDFIRVMHLASGTHRDFPTALNRIREMVWSPDGTMLLVAAMSSGGQDVYLLTPADGQLSRLTYVASFYRGAGWK